MKFCPYQRCENLSNRSSASMSAKRRNLTTLELRSLVSSLPYHIISLILDFTEPFKLVLTVDDFLWPREHFAAPHSPDQNYPGVRAENSATHVNDHDDSDVEMGIAATTMNEVDYAEMMKNKYEIRHSRIIRMLYGYFRKDPLRQHFLVFPNLWVINIDIPHSSYMMHMLPWKHIKHHKFVNDCSDYIVPPSHINLNPFVHAGNRVLHSLDMSYWNFSSNEKDLGVLSEEPRVSELTDWRTRKPKHQIRSLNFSNTPLPECGLRRLILLHPQLTVLDLSDCMPVDLSDGSPMTQVIMSLKLKRLSVVASRLGVQVCQYLCQCNRLRSLYMKTAVSEPGALSSLCQSQSLTNLTFMCNQLPYNVSNMSYLLPSYIPKNFPGNYRLERLELSETPISVAFCSLMFRVFSCVKRLILHNCSLANEHIAALVYRQLEDLPVLTCSLKDLPDMLRERTIHNNAPSFTTPVRELGLRGNAFSLSALKLLCMNSPCLTTLSLTDNNGNLPLEELEEFIQTDESLSSFVNVMID